jgi:lysine 2,3-aminomutase
MTGPIIDVFCSENIEMDSLATAAGKFFKAYGTFKLMGSVAQIFGRRPENRFDMLLNACGYEKDPKGFFQEVFDGISQLSAEKSRKQVVINNIPLPLLFLYWLLEICQPSNHLHSIKTIEQLEKLTGVCPEDPMAVQEVIRLYPVRLSDHVIRQSKVSSAVAIQYLPFAQELDPGGHTLTFDGHFKKGLLEQMYQNRVIFLLETRCPVYCRFCFRKHKSFRRDKNPSVADVQRAVEGVKKLPGVKEVLITGGEPLLNRENMEAALDGLMEIDHIKSVRIATRSIAYYPQLFLKRNGEYLDYLKSKQVAFIERGKQIEIGVHFVHPDEVSLQSLEIISSLVKSGILVYVQTPFLNHLNHEGRVLTRLFTLLRNAGARIYYIFTPCHPIHGTQKYWAPISKSIEAHRYMRAHLSDRCIPKLCTATPLGKMEWHTSGWAVEKDTDPDHIWIRTPYTREYFDLVTGEGNPPHEVQENEDGTLNVKCLINMGDEKLFLGNHSLPEQISVKGDSLELDPSPGLKSDPKPGEQEIQNIKASFFPERFSIASIVETPSPAIARVHKTRVELKIADAPENDVLDNSAMAYLKGNREITDVILIMPDIGKSAVASQLEKICLIADQLGQMEQISCIRIRWQAFQTSPGQFTPEIIEKLVELANFSIGDPLKIEIETWWLLPGQILPEHENLVGKLTCRGIQTYANLALLSGINDTPYIISEMAHRLRSAGMDFHHVYVAGLDVQNKFNRAHPIETDQVLAIASHVRTVCSGREIPLYMIQTPLGEVDFGLTSHLVPRNNIPGENSNGKERYFLRLDPFDISYFKVMGPDFDPAKTGARQIDNTLMVPMEGLNNASGFL